MRVRVYVLQKMTQHSVTVNCLFLNKRTIQHISLLMPDKILARSRTYLLEIPLDAKAVASDSDKLLSDSFIAAELQLQVCWALTSAQYYCNRWKIVARPVLEPWILVISPTTFHPTRLHTSRARISSMNFLFSSTKNIQT